MDISADLTELGQTPIMVVCAGIKSLLDVPRTLQVLVCFDTFLMNYLLLGNKRCDCCNIWIFSRLSRFFLSQ